MENYIEVYNTIKNKQKECYVSSITKDGYPKTRAMLMPVRQDGNVFWFHSNTASQKIQQFKDNPKSCLYFCDPASFTGIVFMGVMEVYEDTETKNAFWEKGYEMYYSKGSSDPDFCMMKFTAHEGDFYGNFNVTKFTIHTTV